MTSILTALAKMTISEWLVAAASVTQAVATVWMVVIYKRMRGIMEDQASIARRQVDVSERQAGISQSQADISERGLTIAEQPFVVVEDVKYERLYANSPVEKFPPSIRYGLKVYGRTPATLCLLYEEFVFAKQLNAKAAYHGSGVTPLNVKLTADDLPYQRKAEPTSPVTDDELRQTGPSTGWFFLIGRVIYEDVFGNEHDYGFCRQCGVKPGPAMPYGGAEYNYRRTTLAKDRPKATQMHQAPEPRSANQ
jgi:hypothetical protein